MPLPRPAPGTGRWWVIGTIGCTIGIALAVWLGLANSLGAITFTDTDYKVIDDTSVRVGFDVHRSPDQAVTCTVQAQDTAHGSSGCWRSRCRRRRSAPCTSRSSSAPPPARSAAACAAACATRRPISARLEPAPRPRLVQMVGEMDPFVRREVVLSFHRAVWTSHCDITANVVGVRAAARTTLSETQPRPTGNRSRSITVSETATPTASYLTQEAFDRLKAELDQMSGEGRTEIAKKIEAARDEGDLKENGGYHAAKEEQGKMEARIRQLTQLLENAIVGAKPADDGIVEPGMVVTVNMFGDDVTFLLGSREIAGDSDIEVYSEKSPLGAAINGKKVGDKASYKAPNGKVIQVSVKGATPHGG